MLSGKRKRYATGKKNGNSVLTEGQVVHIWFSYSKSGMSIRKLAQQFEVSERTVHLIVRGKTWKHLILPGRVVDGERQE